MPNFFWFINVVIYISRGLCLSDVTADIFTDNTGILAAFGDFNGDKHADVFVISSNGQFEESRGLIF